MVRGVQPQGHHLPAHNPTTEDVWVTQDSRCCPSTFNDGSAPGVVPSDSRQRQLKFSTGSGTHRSNINLGIGVFVPRSIYVNIIHSRYPLRVDPSRTGVYFVVQMKCDPRCRSSDMYGGPKLSLIPSSHVYI